MSDGVFYGPSAAERGAGEGERGDSGGSYDRLEVQHEGSWRYVADLALGEPSTPCIVAHYLAALPDQPSDFGKLRKQILQ